MLGAEFVALFWGDCAMAGAASNIGDCKNERCLLGLLDHGQIIARTDISLHEFYVHECERFIIYPTSLRRLRIF